MTLPSENQARSDTTSPPGRPWIVRWRPRVPWIVYGFCLLLLITTSVVIQHLRHQIDDYQVQQQRIRSATANQLSNKIAAIGLSLESAQAAADQNNLAATVKHLSEVQQLAYDADDMAKIYRSVLTEGQNTRSFGLVTTLILYGNVASNLASSIGQEATLSPQNRAQLTALQNDIVLMQTSFPEELLAYAPYEQIAAGMTTFCQQMQTPIPKEAISGMDAVSNAACQSR